MKKKNHNYSWESRDKNPMRWLRECGPKEPATESVELGIGELGSSPGSSKYLLGKPEDSSTALHYTLF